MAWLSGFLSGGAMPALERALSFSEKRHRLILENVANAETPGYRRKDLDVASFRESLRRACGSDGAEVPAPASWALARPGAGGEEVPRQGALRHDGNDVNVELEMALLARNAMHYNAMATLLKKSFDQVKGAISERPLQG